MSPKRPRRIRTLVVTAIALLGLLAPVHASGDAPAQRPKGGVWLAGDLHVHTCYSHDSYCPPEDDNTGPDEFYTLGRSVEEQFCDASRRDLDFLAITDHDDVRSQKDPGFGACGVVPVKGYEYSLRGHAQMLGGDEVFDKGDRSAQHVNALANRLRAKGGAFQINHPAEGSVDWPDDPDWGYGYDVVPDTVEVWNISTMYQPPMPSASSNDDAIRYWEGWLNRGYHVGATGGSDNHWKHTSAAQGPGQPTTWVFAEDRSEAAILEGIREGRTTISSQPPGLGGARVFLEADADGNGTFESIVGDTIPAGAQLRARVLNAPEMYLRIVTSKGAQAQPRVTGSSFEHRFTVPTDAAWVRLEVLGEDVQPERKAACDGPLGGETTYCRNRLFVLALTSAMYVEPSVTNGSTYARIEKDRLVLGNALVERSWSRSPFLTEYMLDKRTGLRTGRANDFGLGRANLSLINASELRVLGATVAPTASGGLALTVELWRAPPEDRPPQVHVTRTVVVHPDVAGFEVRTTLQMDGAVSWYMLDNVVLPNATAQAHAFRAGYDWRGSDSPNWEPTISPLGGHHSGDHRETYEISEGTMAPEAEWLSLQTEPGLRAFMVLERVNYASSMMRASAGPSGYGRATVELDRDVAYLGPFESDVHVESWGTSGRSRVMTWDTPLELERVFTGLAVDADDEAWQHHKYLETRSPDWDRTVVFNSNGVDANRISTGAKDDMDLAEVERQAAVAKRMGVETFVLDDGWQAISGDWCPDSPECPEPRWDDSPTSKFRPRFPDAEFKAVREAIAPMDLGLWMSPMHFNPASKAYAANPTWNCEPAGEALVAANRAQPDSGSNEAGIGTWNPEAVGPNGKLIDYIEGRIRHAIEAWKVRYFKFDFMVWLDCAGLDTVTLYEYRESFLRMLDRLIDDHPNVTFQIDETNDYRMFPFESAYRGPTWYANGHPKANEALHNLWILAPYVPTYTIGQAALGQRDTLSADYLMAVALASHMTFFTDLTKLTDAQVETVARWTELYRRHRDRFASFTYPLLDDPLPGNTWTGLQPWDADRQRGALLVFRQDSPNAKRTVALRGVRGEGTYRLTDAVSGEVFGTFTADDLRAGIPVTLPSRFSARVLLIDPAI